jgi:DNA-binding NtrC family response regulator
LFTGGEERTEDVFLLPEGPISLGRRPPAPGSILLTEDPVLSRTHATLVRRGSIITVEDEDSRNGTFLNGDRVADPVEVHDNDVIRLGGTLLLFRHERAGDEAAPEHGLHGFSPAIRRLRSFIARVAPTPAGVVLLGESGTGKGVAAKALHAASGRAGPFVAVNCAAIPEALAESEFFGHKAGAFTGAKNAQVGYFQAAEGGTLFLDEVGDLPLSLQPKLLHAIEERAVVPVGSTKPIPCDIRIVTATSVDLEEAVRRGRFRGDLFARLAELVVDLPPLRERREDILPLLRRFLGTNAGLEPELADALVMHPWPFNVRELQKVAVELAVKGGGKGTLHLNLVERRLRAFGGTAMRRVASDSTIRDGTNPVGYIEAGRPLRAGPPSREELEFALREHDGVVAEVARAMRRSRKQVYWWLKKHDLDPKAFR